jgi:hypothetical protein|nr:MAG TPA: hypothetical protein [Caudoviricetes sp.]
MQALFCGSQFVSFIKMSAKNQVKCIANNINIY